MRKRILSLLAAGALCMGLSPGALAADQTTLTLSAPDELPAVGETFTVTVSIADNPGVSAVQFTVGSNSAVVECVSAEIGGVLTGALAASNPDASGGAIVAAANSQNMTEDGALGVFTYRVLAPGDADLRITDVILTDWQGNAADYTTETDTLPDDAKPETGQAGDGIGGSEPPETSAPENPTDEPEDEPEEEPEETLEEVPQEQPEEIKPVSSFTDVPAGFWAESYIRRATEAGLFQGYADGSFRPNQSVTRIQFVTVLWRSAGRPAASQAAPFTDMDAAADTDFARAASWGYEQGYIGGYDNGDGTVSFRPNLPVSRQQAMAILFRYSGSASGMEQLLTEVYDSQFTDSGQIASYARSAMYWAVYNGYLSGTSATTLTPGGPATRAQLAKILVEYLERNGA